MKIGRGIIVSAVLAALALVACAALWTSAVVLAAGPGASGYHLKAKFKLGGEGGWDYLSFDAAARRFYISRGTHVMVMDDAGKIVGDIPGTEGVHGIALAPDLGRGFTSNGRSATVTIFDIKTLATIGHAKTGEGPDAIVYDPASKRVFTMNGRAKNSTAIDGSTGEVAGKNELGGPPGSRGS